MKVKKYLQSLLLRSSESTSEKIYQSIDSLPIYNWFKIFDTKELKYLVISGTSDEKTLNTYWEQIFNEYIKVFGLNENFKKYFEQTKKILSLEVKFALTKNEKVGFLLELERKKAEANNPVEEEQSNFMTHIVGLSNAIGRDIDEKTVSVNKFYSYIKQLENEPVKG